MTTIHREGWRFLTKLTLLLILLIWVAVRLGADVNIVSGIAAVILLAFLQFFRRPKRKPPYDSQTVLSPGRVRRSRTPAPIKSVHPNFNFYVAFASAH